MGLQVGGAAQALTFTFSPSLPPSVSPPSCMQAHTHTYAHTHTDTPPLSCSTAATLLVIAIKHAFWVAASNLGPLLEDDASQEDSAGRKSRTGHGVEKKMRGEKKAEQDTFGQRG